MSGVELKTSWLLRFLFSPPASAGGMFFCRRVQFPPDAHFSVRKNSRA